MAVLDKKCEDMLRMIIDSYYCDKEIAVKVDDIPDYIRNSMRSICYTLEETGLIKPPYGFDISWIFTCTLTIGGVDYFKNKKASRKEIIAEVT